MLDEKKHVQTKRGSDLTLCIENVARLSNRYSDRSIIEFVCDRFDKTLRWDFQSIGPLGRYFLQFEMSVCLSICVSVRPFVCPCVHF